MTNAGPLRLQLMTLPSRELTFKKGVLLSTLILTSSNDPRRRSSVVACRWRMAYSIVLQGSAALQPGPSLPLEGSTEITRSAAAALWRHNAQNKSALKSEAAPPPLRLEDDTRSLKNFSFVLHFAASRCCVKGATRSRDAATRIKTAAQRASGKVARGFDAVARGTAGTGMRDEKHVSRARSAS